MKRSYIVLLVIIFCFVSCLSLNKLCYQVESALSKRIESRYTIVIDPGHGGRDNGTSARDNTREKDINLAISKILYDYMMVCGINCVMTRNEDCQVYDTNDDRNRSDLYNRLDFVNSIDNSLLISIHQNHFDDSTQWGMQIWYSANNVESQMIADSIIDINQRLLNNTNQRQNKVSDNSYYILYNAKVPSIMIECGFMSNYEENEKLKNTYYQNDIAFAIMIGYNEFLGC